jgi:hypothetical protein
VVAQREFLSFPSDIGGTGTKPKLIALESSSKTITPAKFAQFIARFAYQKDFLIWNAAVKGIDQI